MSSGHSGLGTSGLAKLGKVRRKLDGDLAAGSPRPVRAPAPSGRQRRRSLLRTRSVWRRRAGAAVPLLLAIAVAFAFAG